MLSKSPPRDNYGTAEELAEQARFPDREYLQTFADALAIKRQDYNTGSLDKTAHWWAGIQGVDRDALARFHDKMLLLGLQTYAAALEQQQLVDLARERMAKQCADTEPDTGTLRGCPMPENVRDTEKGVVATRGNVSLAVEDLEQRGQHLSGFITLHCPGYGDGAEPIQAWLGLCDVVNPAAVISRIDKHGDATPALPKPAATSGRGVGVAAGHNRILSGQTASGLCGSHGRDGPARKPGCLIPTAYLAGKLNGFHGRTCRGQVSLALVGSLLHGPGRKDVLWLDYEEGRLIGSCT